MKTRRSRASASSVFAGYLVLFLALSGCVNSFAASFDGKVVGVTDGDTILVLDSQHMQHKVRLAGIDAPESKQAFGGRSRTNLADLVFGKAVIIEYTKHDRYGRVVGKVLWNGIDVDLQQIESGLAWHYKQYAKEQSSEDRQRYAKAEDKARAAHLGLWQDREPVPPWEWRRSLKGKAY